MKGFLLELAPEYFLVATEYLGQVWVVRIRVVQKQVIGFQFNLKLEDRLMPR